MGLALDLFRGWNRKDHAQQVRVDGGFLVNIGVRSILGGIAALIMGFAFGLGLQSEGYDVGSTDANNAVALGIPAVAIGATLEHMPHRLEETAEASSIVPGIKSLMTLAVTLTSHQ